LGAEETIKEPEDVITALTNIRHWTTSWATLNHSTASHFVYNMFILTL
jgi:hypothetical protein